MYHILQGSPPPRGHCWSHKAEGGRESTCGAVQLPFGPDPKGRALPGPKGQALPKGPPQRAGPFWAWPKGPGPKRLAQLKQLAAMPKPVMAAVLPAARSKPHLIILEGFKANPPDCGPPRATNLAARDH